MFSIEIQPIEVREAQTAKTKDEIQNETEDRRQRDKEKRASPFYPWEHMQRAAREVEEQTHKLLPLHEAINKKNNQSMRVNKPFSYQEIQRIKEGPGDYLEDPEKYIRAFKCVTLLCEFTWKDAMYILGQTLTPDSEIYSGLCTGMQQIEVFSGSLSLGGILEGYSVAPQVASKGEQKSDKGFNGEELDISLVWHKVYPWCISTLPQW